MRQQTIDRLPTSFPIDASTFMPSFDGFLLEMMASTYEETRWEVFSADAMLLAILKGEMSTFRQKNSVLKGFQVS